MKLDSPQTAPREAKPVITSDGKQVRDRRSAYKSHDLLRNISECVDWSGNVFDLNWGGVGTGANLCRGPDYAARGLA
jgi:hypothetical protein